MKLSQISLALINPRLELVNEIQRCNQGPCQNYAKEQWVTPIEALISQVADLIKLNLNFEFLNSFPLLRGWGGGDRKENLLSHTSCPLLSFILPPPLPILKKDIPLHTLGTGGFSSRATRSFVGHRPTRLRRLNRLNRKQRSRMKILWHPG